MPTDHVHRPPTLRPATAPTLTEEAFAAIVGTDITVLLLLAETVVAEPDGGAQLCRAVAELTRGWAQFRLLAVGAHPSHDAGTRAAGTRRLVVAHDARAFGSRFVLPHPARPLEPALPDPFTQPLARVCAAALALLGQGALLRALRRDAEPAALGTLTARQREIPESC